MVIPPLVRPDRVTKFLKPYVLRMHFTNKYVNAQVIWTRGLTSGTARFCNGNSDIGRFYLENCGDGLTEPQENPFHGLLPSARFYNTSSSSSMSHREVRKFSSQTDAGEGDDELEDGFSELETPHNLELSEEECVSADEENELEAVGSVTDVEVKELPRKRSTPKMAKAILEAPALPVRAVLEKWVEEGNEVTREEVSLSMLFFRKRRLFGKALQLSEWVESKKCFEFTEPNYASRLDLIAKMRGIDKAEDYLKKIPEPFKGEIVYRTLLANCVSATNVKKSEELFNKMKSLGFATTGFSCDQLLLLYKRTDKKKIPDVLLLMEKEQIKLSGFTYQILVDVKGQADDIAGMEKIIEQMKAEGLKPTTQIQASLVKYYVAGGLREKAEAILKEMEGSSLKKNRWVCRLLLPLYASLGRADEVERIWRVCEQDPFQEESMAVIAAWGQVKKIEKAEEAFEQMLKKVSRLSPWHFSSLLKVYANHNMFEEGRDLLSRMDEKGCNIGSQTWDAIVKLYVGSGELEKAETVLENSLKQRKGRPLFSSYLSVMDKYANKGDVHKAEKIFMMMREAGYLSRIKQYQSLLKAYINAKVPAYGFSDRMKADNLYPNTPLANQLAKTNPFRKSNIDDLLE